MTLIILVLVALGFSFGTYKVGVGVGRRLKGKAIGLLISELEDTKAQLMNEEDLLAAEEQHRFLNEINETLKAENADLKTFQASEREKIKKELKISFNKDRDALNILDEEINLTTSELESLKEQARNKRDDTQAATEDLDRLKFAQQVIRKKLSSLIDDNIIDMEICREIVEYLMTKLGLTNWGNTLASYKDDHKSEIAWLVSQGYLHTFPGRGGKGGPEQGQALFSLDPEKTSKSTGDFYTFYEEYRKNRQSIFENSTAVEELKALLT